MRNMKEENMKVKRLMGVEKDTVPFTTPKEEYTQANGI